MNFKNFLIESENKDVKTSLLKLPKKHRALISGYKVVFEDGNTIKGDGDHVGFIDEEKKTITIAAPWNYGREYAFLHEVGHVIWKYIVDEDMRKKWNKLVKQHKAEQKNKVNSSNSLDQNTEELFCMVYAAVYSNHPPITFSNKAWESFVKSINN